MSEDDLKNLKNNKNKLIKIDYSEILNNKNDIQILLESLNDMILFLDKNLRIIYYNSEKLIKNLNYKTVDLIGKKFTDFVYESSNDKIKNLVENILKNNNKPRFEIKIKDKNLNDVWFELKGIKIQEGRNKIQYLFILKNINEIKNTEEKYKNLFESSPNAIILLNFSGLIIDVNSTTTKIFEEEKNKFLNQPIHKFPWLYPPEIRSFFKKIFKAAFKGNFPEPIEVQLKTKDKIIWVLIQASLVKVKQSILIQIIYQDITEKKKIELLEKEFKKQLEIEVEKRTTELNNTLKEQKLYLDQIIKTSQFKTEFMSTMSHELRTPLNAIIGFTDLLLEGVYGTFNSDQIDILNDIKFASEHQFEMIKNILDISKIEAGKLKLNRSKININNILNNVVSMCKLELKNKEIQIHIKGLEKERVIFADPIQMREILLNLISNAIKFTEEGKIEIIFNEDKDKWIIIIKDTGIGIHEKDFNIIFKEFCRVDSEYVRSKPGTGLGLSLTKRLISLHGGDIWFESKFGYGTKFIFSIPKINNDI